MIFRYNELKEFVQEDFDRFYQMGFDAAQIAPAVLNEYEYGEDFCWLEHVCIYIFLGLNYKKRNLACPAVTEALKHLLTCGSPREAQDSLGDAHTTYLSELEEVLRL